MIGTDSATKICATDHTVERSVFSEGSGRVRDNKRYEVLAVSLPMTPQAWPPVGSVLFRAIHLYRCYL